MKSHQCQIMRMFFTLNGSFRSRRRFPCKGSAARGHAKYQSKTPYFGKIL